MIYGNSEAMDIASKQLADSIRKAMDRIKDKAKREILPEPMTGYEWAKRPSQYGDHTITFEQRPIRKMYDWSKTGPNVLVATGKGRKLFRDAHAHKALVCNVWQAHIGGDPCPVHAEATMVEVRADGIVTHAGKASDEDWSYDCLWRVTGLVEGYSYE